ncbi:MAG: Hsp20/alpha crystallin family protein [Planctomycetota bacterium]
MTESIRLKFWQEFEEIQSQINQMMQNLFKEAHLFQEIPIVFSPPVNVYETDNHLVINAVIPGAIEEDIDVTIAGKSLVIRGEITEPTKWKRSKQIYQEWNYGYFEREISLPYTVEPETAEIVYENGILKIMFNIDVN